MNDSHQTGISLAHGVMTEDIVTDTSHVVPVPESLAQVAFLTEPLSCITKSLRQAEQVQARLDLWQAKRALVTGAGTIGLCVLAALKGLGLPGRVVVAARHPHQAEAARRLGLPLSTVPEAGFALPPQRRQNLFLGARRRRRRLLPVLRGCSWGSS